MYSLYSTINSIRLKCILGDTITKKLLLELISREVAISLISLDGIYIKELRVMIIKIWKLKNIYIVMKDQND